MYAIDSLRQLSMKFLEKDELANYQFQKEFLRPFEHIFSNQPVEDLRYLVVRIMQQMILVRARNIKSGWHGLLHVFAAAASDSSGTPLLLNGTVFVLCVCFLLDLGTLEKSRSPFFFFGVCLCVGVLQMLLCSWALMRSRWWSASTSPPRLTRLSNAVSA